MLKLKQSLKTRVCIVRPTIPPNGKNRQILTKVNFFVLTRMLKSFV